MSMITKETDPRRNGERGSVIIMTAISMVFLFLLVGLCIDVSRIYMVRAELQNAADAAALTAARELDAGTGGIDDAVTRANAILNTQGFRQSWYRHSVDRIRHGSRWHIHECDGRKRSRHRRRHSLCAHNDRGSNYQHSLRS